MSFYRKLSVFIIAASYILGLYFYRFMPPIMASHWNIVGQVDGYIPKFWGLFLMPVISTMAFALLSYLPRIDPLRKNVKRFKKTFEQFIFFLVLFLFYIYLLTIVWNLGVIFNLTQAFMPGLAVVFYSSGSLLEKAKRNWFIGIRTPWTLESDEVWGRTHKLGGLLFKFLAIPTIIGAFFPEIAFYIVIIPALAFTVYLFFYSYYIYKSK
jgi:uncharacterized membrane protein